MTDEEWARLERFLTRASSEGTGLELDHRDVLETQPKSEQENAARRTGPIKVKVDTSRFRT